MIPPFLTIIGIGEDGIASLSSIAKSRLQDASIIFGGKRHLMLANSLIRGKTEIWSNPIHHSIQQILTSKSQSVAVLASGDPFWYGIGPLITKHLTSHEWESFPTISSKSLTCNRLGWSEQEIETVSLCGRPVHHLKPFLTPFRKLIILSANENTPYEVNKALQDWRLTYKKMHILEALGGEKEQIRCFSPHDPLPEHISPLNIIALELDTFLSIPFVHGRQDSLFSHDGQLTKQIIRSTTLSALQPYPGALLWDIGTGSGSIAIEWMLAHPTCKAIAIEPDPERALRAKNNALALGVSNLSLIEGKAPEALKGLPIPDAIFIGGGITSPNLLQIIWNILPQNGRLVINSVTMEADSLIFQAFQQWGGEINRLDVQHYEPLGSYHGFKPQRTITQYSVTHP